MTRLGMKLAFKTERFFARIIPRNKLKQVFVNYFRFQFWSYECIDIHVRFEDNGFQDVAAKVHDELVFQLPTNYSFDL